MADNFYATAVDSFNAALGRIPQDNSGLYQIALGLKRLAEALQEDSNAASQRLAAIEAALSKK